MSYKLLANVRMTVANTPGTGAITLGAPTSANFQSAAAAGLADADTAAFMTREPGSGDWELHVCTYTASGTSLARTRRVASSTGSAISFTAAAIIESVLLPEDVSSNVQITGGFLRGLTDLAFAAAVSVASASTADIGAAASAYVNLTGTTTITSLGTVAASTIRWLKFAGALTLTHNATSLILPGAANITTAAGDTALAMSEGSGNWRVLAYQRADGHPLIALQATLASATSTDLGSVPAQSITISGTTAITGLGSTAPTGAVKFIEFSGALTLTHNATSLILPGAANITTVAGDCAVFRHEGSGNWRALSYMRAAGYPLLLNLAGANAWTGRQLFGGTASAEAMAAINIIEPGTVSATAATGTINYDVTTQSVLYYTSNASANWTLNFRGSSGTSLDSLMATSEFITVAFLVTQGGSAFYNNVVQVDGNAVTPKWQGGTAPTSGNASGVDVYTYTILKTGSAAFTIFASQTQFK